jgi:uncharacterized protein
LPPGPSPGRGGPSGARWVAASQVLVPGPLTGAQVFHPPSCIPQTLEGCADSPLLFLSPSPQASAAGGSPAPPSFVYLKYDYVPDILAKRDPYRAEHLAAAKKKAEEGKLVIAGALAEPVDGACFIFKGMTTAEVEGFVKSDPYFKAGLITAYAVRPYLAVAGGVL